MMFGCALVLVLVACCQVSTAAPVTSGVETQTWRLSDSFTLFWDSHLGQLLVTQDEQDIWSTVPRSTFVSASAGNDSVIGSNGNFNITQVDEDLCQGQNVTQIQSVPWQGTVTGSAVTVSGSLLDCGSVSLPYALTLSVPANLTDRVAFYLDVQQPSGVSQTYTKLYLQYQSESAEDFYGLGAQASFASLKNQSIPIFSREGGVGRGDEPVTSLENANGSFAGGDKVTTYTAIPQYITTEGRVFYLSEKSTAYANFDLTQPDAITVRYDSLAVDGQVMRASDMFGAVEMLTAYTGRMPPLPVWVDTGAILGIQGGQDKVNNIVEQGLNISCPIAGVWLQDWCGTHSQAGPYISMSRLWWNWENDADLYPAWPEFVQNLRDDHNVRTLSYINVFLANVSSKSDGYKRNLYDEASALQYFVQNTTTNSTAIISSGPGLDAGIVDLTNDELRSWFTDVLRTQVWSANISGFMSDFGEYTPVTSDTRLAQMVSDAFFYHNEYPRDWAQLQRGVADDLGLQSEALIFHRSAAFTANRYMNLFWVGDQNVDWGLNDGLKSVVTIMGHMGFCGYAHQHSDLGGYTDTLTYSNYNLTRSAETLARWGELAAVTSPVFRSHEGNIPSVNAQFYSNATTYTYYAYNARMFAALAPYRRLILDTECATKGWPLLRPPVMYHTQDPLARATSYQSFYLGPKLYVAPVFDPLTFEVEVYLPGIASFLHVWSGVSYQGGQTVRVAAPYGKPAVFVVNGTVTRELQSFMDFVKTENATVLSVD